MKGVRGDTTPDDRQATMGLFGQLTRRCPITRSAVPIDRGLVVVVAVEQGLAVAELAEDRLFGADDRHGTPRHHQRAVEELGIARRGFRCREPKCARAMIQQIRR